MGSVCFRVGMILACMSSWAAAQTRWDVLEDFESVSTCGIVNAVSAATGSPIQLVILSGTAELMIVSRTDTILSTTFVDADNFVFDNGEPKGVIEFADDGDGFRTVWWVSPLDGRVVEVDPFTVEAFPGTRFPEEFVDVPCLACNFVDFPPAGACDADSGGGGVTLPAIVVNLCGSGIGSTGMILMALCGFLGLRFVRRRY